MIFPILYMIISNKKKSIFADEVEHPVREDVSNFKSFFYLLTKIYLLYNLNTTLKSLLNKDFLESKQNQKWRFIIKSLKKKLFLGVILLLLV